MCIRNTKQNALQTRDLRNEAANPDEVEEVAAGEEMVLAHKHAKHLLNNS